MMLRKGARRLFSTEVKTYLRQAQSIELFRSKFCQTIGSDVSISVGDIDDLVKTNNVRPSSLIAGVELLGLATGIAYKLTPSPVKSYIVKGVNDAVAYQLNNSIRDLQDDDHNKSSSTATASAAENYLRADVKDTLKFHRDITVSTEAERAATNKNDNADSNSTGSIGTPNVVGLALGTVFDLTKTL